MMSWFRKRPNRALPAGERVYAIGDVHGRLDLVDALLERARADDAARPSARTTLIFLGDLIDRGPASRGVVARVREGVAWAKTVALMGNHEAVMLDVLNGRTDSVPGWLRFGGRQTLLSWGVPAPTLDEGTAEEIVAAARAVVSADERNWLQQLRSHLQIGDYYFVHAGVRPGIPLDRQTDEDRLWIRQQFLASRREHGALIVHGHSITDDVEQKGNRIGLDTGAYMSGRLTALALEGDARWLLST